MAKRFNDLVRRTTSKEVQKRVKVRAEQLLEEMLLSEIRQARQVSQQELADSVGIRQPSLSKLERQNDMQISTLDRLVSALGGTLTISARFEDKVVTLKNFNQIGTTRQRPARKPAANAKVARKRSA